MPQQDHSWQRRLHVGAEVQPQGGVHFRVWAPLRRAVTVELHLPSGAGKLPLAGTFPVSQGEAAGLAAFAGAADEVRGAAGEVQGDSCTGVPGSVQGDAVGGVAAAVGGKRPSGTPAGGAGPTSSPGVSVRAPSSRAGTEGAWLAGRSGR